MKEGIGDTTFLPSAFDRIETWATAWQETGSIIVFLDFDGTLAPIVERPEAASMPDATRRAVERLVAGRGAHVAIISGRGLADARERVGIPDIMYAGNHGMEIEAPGLSRVHPEAAAARPALDRAISILTPLLGDEPGTIIEDKGLTLSIHYRLVERSRVDSVRKIVREVVMQIPGVRVTEGKAVLEIRPAVDWHKGRAVTFILDDLAPGPGVPILYLGDDRTDEDAFEALNTLPAGEGVIVADPMPGGTAARAYLRTTEEVARLIDMLANGAPA